jgi:hypothetical protein
MLTLTTNRRHCCIVGDSSTFERTASVSGLMDYINEHGVVSSALEYTELHVRSPAAPKKKVVAQASAQPASFQLFPGEVVPCSHQTGLHSNYDAQLPIDFFAKLADLNPGSGYLAHRAKGTVVSVTVRYRDRTASVKASLDEPVAALKRRASVPFSLQQVFLLSPEKLKLLCKGTLHDTDLLRDTAVKSGSDVMLVVSGDSPVEAPSARIVEALEEFMSGPANKMAFPASLNPAQRAVCHEFAERHGLEHVSSGQGPNRFVTVLKPHTAAAKLIEMEEKVGPVEANQDIPEFTEVATTVTKKSKLGVDLKALHEARVKRHREREIVETENSKKTGAPTNAAATLKNGAKAKSSGVRLSDGTDEWALPAPVVTGSSKKVTQKSLSKKVDRKKTPELEAANTAAADDDMAYMDAIIQSQANAKRLEQKGNPAWKRWVSSDGVLHADSTRVEDEREKALKIALQLKVTAQQDQRVKAQKKGGGGSGK